MTVSIFWQIKCATSTWCYSPSPGLVHEVGMANGVQRNPPAGEDHIYFRSTWNHHFNVTYRLLRVYLFVG